MTNQRNKDMQNGGGQQGGADREKAQDPRTVMRAGPTRGVSRPMVGPSMLQAAHLILDVSPSMDAPKLGELNAATAALLAELGAPANRRAFWVSAVVFASSAKVHLPPRCAADVRPEEIAVAGGGVGSGTNINAGLRAALAEAEKPTLPGTWARPISVLMSDGQDNPGCNALPAAIALKAKMDLICVGFGAGADMDLLARLATSPGHAVRCANGAELRRWFQAVGATMSRAALTGAMNATALLQGSMVRG